jgi:23S rRNA (cytidine1920-2'-O)/16S rRNA (cytidine1409-2'-O)-methyltransferase
MAHFFYISLNLLKKNKKIRIDALLMELGIAPTIERAQALILAGEIKVQGVPINSGAQLVSLDCEIESKESARFVSRAGLKLSHALENFQINPHGKICADVGAATGGFSDVLLQANAARVYAVDVGYGDLHWKVRSDSRLIPIERTNARYLEELPERVSFIAVDVSFISLKTLLPVFTKWISLPATFVLLIKPQFEAASNLVGEGGVITDPLIHREVLQTVLLSAQEYGYTLRGLIPSPILGKFGNKEFLAWLETGGDKAGKSAEELLEKLF